MSDEILRQRPTEIAIARKDTAGNGNRVSRESRVPNDRSVPELVRELSHEGSELVRNELALAKAEVLEKLATLRSGSVTMAVGGGLLLAALLLLIQALSHVLTALLAGALGLAAAALLAPLILALVVGATGWGVFQSAKHRIAKEIKHG